MTNFLSERTEIDMQRLLLVAIALTLLILPATAEGQSSLRLRGTVVAKHAASDLVSVRTRSQAVALRIPGSMALIRVGQRVELRGSTLRTHGNGSRVIGRDVSIASSRLLSAPSLPRADDDEPDDDEVEIKGRLTSLAPLTVRSTTRSVTCTVPARVSLAGFAAGDFVEITCDLIGGTWVLRKLRHEDPADDDDDSSRGRDSEDDDRSGPGGGDDDDDDDDDVDDRDDDDDSSGHGSGGGDDDD